MYSVTIFKNTFDNKTHRRVTHDSWDAFERMFLNLSKKEGNKGGNNSSPLISPAIYHEGGTRSNKNVVEWGHCVLWILTSLILLMILVKHFNISVESINSSVIQPLVALLSNPSLDWFSRLRPA